MIMKSVIPVVMAGIIAIYGVVVAVLISQSSGDLINDNGGDLTKIAQNIRSGFMHFGAGSAAGFAIGIVGDAGVRRTAQQPKLYVGMILILI